MLISHIRQVTIASAIGFFGFGSLAASAPAPTSGTPRVIEIIADKDNTFNVPGESKPIITLQQGETVILRITSHFGGEKSRRQLCPQLCREEASRPGMGSST